MIITKNIKKIIPKISFLVLLMVFNAFVTYAQNRITLKGTVSDKSGETIIGAVVAVK